MATLGVQFAQSLATALAVASLMLLAGLVVVRAVRTWSQRSTGNGPRGNRPVLQPALAIAGEAPSPIRPSAGVAKAGAPTRAPPTTFGALRQQRQSQVSPVQLRRLAV